MQTSLTHKGIYFQEQRGGNFTQTGQQVTITNNDDDATIEAGESVTLGFNASWKNDDTSPTTLSVSGGAPAK